MDDHHVVSVSIFTSEHRSPTLVATTDTGRTLTAGHPGNHGDNPRLLNEFADLIADAEQREQNVRNPAYGPVHRSGITITKLPNPVTVPAGTTTTLDAITRQGDAHYCGHGNQSHPCACPANADHTNRICPGHTYA